MLLLGANSEPPQIQHSIRQHKSDNEAQNSSWSCHDLWSLHSPKSSFGPIVASLYLFEPPVHPPVHQVAARARPRTPRFVWAFEPVFKGLRMIRLPAAHRMAAGISANTCMISITEISNIRRYATTVTISLGFLQINIFADGMWEAEARYVQCKKTYRKIGHSRDGAESCQCSAHICRVNVWRA